MRLFLAIFIPFSTAAHAACGFVENGKFGIDPAYKAISVKNAIKNIKKFAPPEKDEYESTLEYNARIKKHNIDILSNAESIENKCILVPAKIQYSGKYDADKKRYSFSVSGITNTATYVEDHKIVYGNGIVSTLPDIKKMSSYIGSNAFGVKKKISKELYESNDIFIAEESGYYLREFIDFAIYPDVARRCKDICMLAVYGKPKYPFTGYNTTIDSPTIDNPVDETVERNWLFMSEDSEYIVYDKNNGEIYYREPVLSIKK